MASRSQKSRSSRTLTASLFLGPRGRLVSLGLFVFLAQSLPPTAHAQVPSALPSGTASPLPQVAIEQFLRAQRTELRALAHRQLQELKQLSAAQRARRKEFLSHEKSERHRYFKEKEPGGSEKRAYIEAYYNRLKELDQRIKAERAERSAQYDQEKAALVQKQKENEKAFRAAVQRGEQPASELWP